MKSQTTKIYSQLDDTDIKLIAALLRELGYGAEGRFVAAKINVPFLCAGGIEVSWEHEVKDNA